MCKTKREFMVYFGIKVIITILGLLTNIYIIRKLSVNDYGVFSVAFMLIGFATTFGFSWSSSSILYYGSKEKAKYGNLNKTFWARNIIMLCSLAVTTGLFLLLRGLINEFVGVEVSLLILLWLYVSVSEDYLSRYFLAVGKQLLSGMLSLSAKLVYLALVLLTELDVRTLISLNIISHASVLLYALGLNRKDIGRFEFDKSWFSEVLNFSLWQLFGFSGLYLINFGDTVVINYFMTSADVGIYNAAYRLFDAVANFAFVVSNYYASSVSSFFSQNDRRKIRKFFYRERPLIFGLCLTAHIMVMILARPIVVTLYGVQYAQSVGIFTVLMVGSVAKYFSVFYMLYYNTNRLYVLQQAINIGRAILNVVLDVIFIESLGLIGPAVATTVSIVLSLLFSVMFCERRIRRACIVDSAST